MLTFKEDKMLTFKEDIYSTSNLMANSCTHAQKSGDVSEKHSRK